VRVSASSEYAALESDYTAALAGRSIAAHAVAESRLGSEEARAAEHAFQSRNSQVDSIRTAALALAGTVTREETKDVNYIIPRFVLTQLPLGFAGLFVAAIMAAAMSSIAAELNSLATSTIVDFYLRWFKPEGGDAHVLAVSRTATLFWGVVACFVATYAATLGSLIEVVNRFGSFFYGSILGIFLLAMIPSARAWPAFFALLAGMASVAAVSYGAPSVSYLWHNVVGALTVLLVGIALSAVFSGRSTAQPDG
jgi:Na+/proline symporter